MEVLRATVGFLYVTLLWLPLIALLAVPATAATVALLRMSSRGHRRGVPMADAASARFLKQHVLWLLLYLLICLWAGTFIPPEMADAPGPLWHRVGLWIICAASAGQAAARIWRAAPGSWWLAAVELGVTFCAAWPAHSAMMQGRPVLFAL